MKKLLFKTCVIMLVCQIHLLAKDYNASLFGIKSDGVTLNTPSIQKAIDFISEKGGGKLKFYVGRYLTGSIQLKSNVTIELNEGAVLVGTSSIYDYVGANGIKALIVAEGQQNIGVLGKGVIEGQGPAVLEQIEKQIQKGYLKETISQASPALIAMNNCSGINIEGFNLQNACGNVIALAACKQVRLAGLRIKSTSNKESKGFVFSKVDEIKLENLFIETVVSEIKSDGLSTNISMANCQYASGKKLIFKN